MKFSEYAETLERIKQLTELGNAGPPEELASKLQISTRTVQRMIQRLRQSGYPIRFNRGKSGYEVESSKKN